MSESMLSHVEQRGVHSLTMDAGPNPLDQALMGAIRERLRMLSDSGAPPVLLSSSHPSLFCPGWDLKRLAAATRDEVGTVLEAFNGLILELFSYPAPTAAVVGGHAVAGGCLLAMACDLRIMASGRPRLGLAELNLGVPVPAGSLWMLQARLAGSAVEDLVLRGEGCAAERARDLGLVHRVALADEVAAVADRELRSLASKSSAAYAATKRLLYGQTWERMRAVAQAETEVFLDCWFDEDTQERIATVARGLATS
jgi:enoyl-CoA hydratase/carnithine racemase